MLFGGLLILRVGMYQRGLVLGWDGGGRKGMGWVAGQNRVGGGRGVKVWMSSLVDEMASQEWGSFLDG